MKREGTSNPQNPSPCQLREKGKSIQPKFYVSPKYHNQQIKPNSMSEDNDITLMRNQETVNQGFYIPPSCALNKGL